MQNIYTIPLHMSSLVYLICALLLFLRRKSGERSRIILAYISLISFFNRVLRLICIYNNTPSSSVVSPTMLILAIAMITLNLIYAIEVISPKWLNIKRTANICLPLIISSCIYIITQLIGVEYTRYNSLIEMLPMIDHLDVIFRFVLCIIFFIPIFFLFFIPYTKKYNNTNKEWIWSFMITITIANTCYVSILAHDNYITHTIYLYVSAACALFITYQEIFIRLIDKSYKEIPNHYLEELAPATNNKENSTEINLLFNKLDKYMKMERAWREPDLSIILLSQYLNSNRTSLAKAIQSGGYGNFHNYVAHYRIKEFCEILKLNKHIKIDDLFYQVGFRSRSTAFINFKKQMNMTPFEYYKSLPNI